MLCYICSKFNNDDGYCREKKVITEFNNWGRIKKCKYYKPLSKEQTIKLMKKMLMQYDGKRKSLLRGHWGIDYETDEPVMFRTRPSSLTYTLKTYLNLRDYLETLEDSK